MRVYGRSLVADSLHSLQRSTAEKMCKTFLGTKTIADYKREFGGLTKGEGCSAVPTRMQR
ncbi:hypothetical protein CE91St49_03600 [Emergencia timonensis]|nr:hypothetical protein CE91St48_03600 [Emergencia timonensis]BDF11013.1 hypothetical protein CE91St49_03600 [Emergencia timonensis]